MKKRLVNLFFILLFLASCSYPGSAPTSQPEVKIPAVEDSVSGETSLPPLPSPTSPPSPTGTATELPVPTATLPSASPTLLPVPLPTLPPLTAGDQITITQIEMVDLESGWGVGYQESSGDHILHTQDGGATWEDRTPPDSRASQPGESGSAWAHFLDFQNAWVIYASPNLPPAQQEKRVWWTENAGLTWQASATLQADGMEDIFIPEAFTSVGDSLGWLLVHVGGGMSHDYSYLYHTRDGGQSWERLVDPYTGGIQSLRNTGIAFVDPEYGWVSKDNLGVMPGAFFEQTQDGGRTWEDVFLPIPAELDWFSEPALCETSQPTFTTAMTGLLIVKCRLPGDLQREIEWSHTYIYRTGDRGQTWTHTRLPSPVAQLLFLDPERGWAFGRDYYQTSDGGLTWEFVKTVFWDGDFSFPDLLHGWAVARNEGEIALVATGDGGQTWRMIESRAR
jgi:photosystem II stability/assembly factor-like uncharacterized protein